LGGAAGERLDVISPSTSSGLAASKMPRSTVLPMNLKREHHVQKRRMALRASGRGRQSRHGGTDDGEQDALPNLQFIPRKFLLFPEGLRAGDDYSPTRQPPRFHRRLGEQDASRSPEFKMSKNAASPMGYCRGRSASLLGYAEASPASSTG